MAHDHTNAHSHHRHDADSTGVRGAFFLNAAFTIIELVGGLLTNSVAVLSDAVHDLGDTAALGLAWYFQHLGRQGATPRFTYGFRRFNTLGALITSAILIVGSVVIVIRAIPRLIHPEPVAVTGVIGLAILGVIVNGAAVWRLRRAGTNSLNEESVSLHLLEDVFGWVAVLIGAGIMYFVPSATWIDPLLSLGIATWVLLHAVGTLRRALLIMLQAKPEDVDTSLLEIEANKLAGAGKAQHLHVWTLDGEYHLASIDVVVDPEATAGDLSTLRERIRGAFAKLGVEHVTVEFVTTASKECKDGAISKQPRAGHSH